MLLSGGVIIYVGSTGSPCQHSRQTKPNLFPVKATRGRQQRPEGVERVEERLRKEREGRETGGRLQKCSKAARTYVRKGTNICTLLSSLLLPTPGNQNRMHNQPPPRKKIVGKKKERL